MRERLVIQWRPYHGFVNCQISGYSSINKQFCYHLLAFQMRRQNRFICAIG